MRETKRHLPSLTDFERQKIEQTLRAKGLPYDINVTFDDVTIPEDYSAVRSRSEILEGADFKTVVAPGIGLSIPIVSANMESVSGVKLIAEIERLGGLGIPPQTLPPDEQLKIIEQVGQEDCAYRENPLTVNSYQTINEIHALYKKFNVQGFFVIDDQNHPVGVLAARDWLYETDKNKTVAACMGGGRLQPLITAPRTIDFREAARLLTEHRIEKLPLVDSDGKLAGAIFANGLFYKYRYPAATRNTLGQFLKVASIGVSARFGIEQLRFIENAVRLGVSLLVVDTARAYAVNTEEALGQIKRHFSSLPIIAGNVSTPEGAKALIEWGADCVKIGQGPGEACRTRNVGTGIPQLSACAKCSVVAHLNGKTVMLDGGMKSPGDIGKALLAGADAVMLGYMLVGTEESAALAYYNKDGHRVKQYEGSASFAAQLKRHLRGELDRIRRPEGINEEVHVRGAVSETIEDILAGLASLFSYVGVRSLKEFKERARFELVTWAGFFEGSKRKI